MSIQLHRLEGFYRVARAEGYARAARSFPYPITQPGVHQQVKKLEAELQVVLFERVGKDRVKLTPAGQRLYAFAAPFFEELPEVVRELAAARWGGVLRIDAAGLVLRTLLPDWIRRLRRARPDVDVEVVEIQTPDLERLRTGAADLLVDYVAELPSGYRALKVGTSHTFVALPADHALARRKRRTLGDLAGDPFVSYHPSLRQNALQMKALERMALRPRRVISASSVDSILAFVRAGLGWSLVPWTDPRGPRLDGVVFERLRWPEARFALSAVRRATPWPSPLVDAALEAAPDP